MTIADAVKAAIAEGKRDALNKVLRKRYEDPTGLSLRVYLRIEKGAFKGEEIEDIMEAYNTSYSGWSSARSGW